jgi:pyruvate kinase
MTRTKIVATLGPASSEPETLKRLIESGVDVFRLNFSHGTRESHRALIGSIRKVCDEVGSHPALLQDLCGPKIRTGLMVDDAVELESGSTVVITTEDTVGTAARFSTNYEHLPRDVSPGSSIRLNDGMIELRVSEVSGHEVQCLVICGGTLGSRKGINLPYTAISAPSVTEKDLADLDVGIEEGVDFVALSFVRTPADITAVKDILAARGSKAQVIAKIEKPEAVDCIEDIITVADGILVARGDLGVEMDLARVPLLQKRIIRAANEQDKYVIVATQMLESMINSRVPTRAEVSDVTNAIIDGADAVMLSGETAMGRYPVEAVAMMDRVARETEAYLVDNPARWDWARVSDVNPVQEAIGQAAFQLCADLDAAAIVAFSATGGTALYLSKSRPGAVIVAFTASKEAFRRMRMFWGVEPVLDADISSKDDLLAKAKQYLKDQGVASDGRPLLVVAGSHFGQVGSTNAVEVAF